MNKLIILTALVIACFNSIAQSRPNSGVLFLAGGSVEDPTVIERFVELSGGKESVIVVIPTASSDKSLQSPDLEGRLRNYMQRHGAAKVEVLHTRTPEEANNYEFNQALKKATGIWFWGGRASRLSAAYQGTLFSEEVKKVFKRGGVVGGTSAGAVILSEILVRGDKDNTDLIKPSEGFGLISGIALDVHFLARNRIHPFSQFLDSRPELVGIGIDEDTAIILRGNELEVVGNSYVTIFGINGRSEPFTMLASGDRFDFVRRKIVGNCNAWSSGCVPE